MRDFPLRWPTGPIVALLGLGFALAGSGCAWQTYAVTRTIREVTGAKTRLHVIVPVRASLRAYRVIEVRPLSDLFGARVPPAMERYLDDRIRTALRDLPSSPAVVGVPAPIPGETRDEAADGSPEATLVVEGFLDDYEEGSRSLRLVELGFNHIAVTVRIRLRDKTSGRLLGAASVTAEDDRASGTIRAAINNTADRIRGFVETGYAR